MLALAAAAVAVALGVWGWQQYRQQVTDKASEQYEAGLEAAQQGDLAAAARNWTAASKSGSAAYKTLALMQLGGLKILGDASNPAGDPKAAVALFDQAAQAAPDDVMADAARLKSALAILDTAPFVEVEGRLAPLMKEGRPYRVQAREALAFAKLMKGDDKGARSDFVVIQNALDAPDNARQRASAAISMIDSGSAKAVAAAAKAAMAAPPPTLVMPGVAPAAPGQQPEAAPPQ